MIDIIFKDESLLAVNKPPGLLSVPGRALDNQDCLINQLHSKFPEALLIHRLDMDTSGVMIFARSSFAQKNLAKAFEQRKIKKKYVAWVNGIIEDDEGEIDLPIRKDMQQSLPPKHVVDFEHGKRSITKWNVSKRNDLVTRLDLYPLTGRSHQLRVHLKEINHPIIGDPIYGARKERMLLHAEKLCFNHPLHDKWLELESVAPF